MAGKADSEPRCDGDSGEDDAEDGPCAQVGAMPPATLGRLALMSARAGHAGILWWRADGRGGLEQPHDWHRLATVPAHERGRHPAQGAPPRHRNGRSRCRPAVRAAVGPSRGCCAGRRWPATRSAGFMCSAKKCGVRTDHPGAWPRLPPDQPTLLTAVAASATGHRVEGTCAFSRGARMSGNTCDSA